MMKTLFTLLCVAALAALAVVLGRAMLGGGAIRVEWLLAAVAVTLVVARWRAVARRRQRQKLQEMRDSALW
ncbi:hypothetical protein [Ramlibacter sp.]|uniref:hypothetical protein n=1 Tax=Ramlibacter sp. TaxID=1917967 RepID=UPI002CDF8A67|nr:hypothetical protein [Ramlibacter sp.]HWI82364.1 hypothetical protein [Ramlibacter sp.]